MDKRGNALIVLGFFFALFLIFFFLEYEKPLSFTGYTIFRGGNNNFSISDLTLDALDVDSDNSFSPKESDYFYRNEMLGCYFNYNITQNHNPNLTVGFYSQDRNQSNPDEVFYDIFNKIDLDQCEDNVCCDNDLCLIYFNATSFKSGNWKCFVSWDNFNVTSNSLPMINSPPIFHRTIPTIRLDTDGRYINESDVVDLDRYYSDLEGSDLEYGAVGQLHIQVSVSRSGKVSFNNPRNWEGTESILFRAYDGLNGTFSNNVTIIVGSGVSAAPVPICSPSWDCTWGNCNNGQQVCTYFDRNRCNRDTGKPQSTIRSCAIPNVLSDNVNTQANNGLANFNFSSINANVPVVGGTQRNLLILGVVILVLLILGFGTYFVLNFNKNKKVDIIQQGDNIQETKIIDDASVNLDELKKYIEESLKQGELEPKIRADLIKTGWQKKEMDAAFNFINVKLFVKNKLAAGFDKEKIITSLKSKGWKEDLINSIMKELE